MTSRVLPNDLADEIQLPRLSPIILYEGEFAEGNMLRMWTGYGPLIVNSVTFFGAGNMLDMSAIEETIDNRALGIEVGLSGVPEDVLSAAIQSTRVNKVGTIYFTCLDENRNVVADPTIIFSGTSDAVKVSFEPSDRRVSIAYEPRLLDMQRPNERRYTDADQKSVHPADRGFEYVNALQDADIVWGGERLPADSPRRRAQLAAMGNPPATIGNGTGTVPAINPGQDRNVTLPVPTRPPGHQQQRN